MYLFRPTHPLQEQYSALGQTGFATTLCPSKVQFAPLNIPALTFNVEVGLKAFKYVIHICVSQAGV